MIILFKTVQPVPAPFSTKALTNNSTKEGGNSQKLILFSRGNQIHKVISYFFGLCLHPTYNWILFSLFSLFSLFNPFSLFSLFNLFNIFKLKFD